MICHNVVDVWERQAASLVAMEIVSRLRKNVIENYDIMNFMQNIYNKTFVERSWFSWRMCNPLVYVSG